MVRLKNTFFKFLKPKHANSMLDKGEVYLPDLYSFLDGKNKKDLTIDEDEASFNAELYIDNYDSTKNTELPAIFKSGLPNVTAYSRVRIVDHTIKYENVRLANAWCYCATIELCSASLLWAIDAKKNSCVMILDPGEFLTSIEEDIKRKFPDAVFSEWSNCIYTDNPYRMELSLEEARNNENEIAPSAVPAPMDVYWHKDISYKAQKEVRFIGHPRGGNDPHWKGCVPPHRVCLPSLKDILMEIDISEIDRTKLERNREGYFTYRFEYKDSSSPTVCKVKRSFDDYALMTRGRDLMLCTELNRESKDDFRILRMGKNAKHGQLCEMRQEGEKTLEVCYSPLNSVKRIVVLTEDD